MSDLTKLTTNLSVISALPDEPDAEDGYTPEVLKGKFDEAAESIKTYINNTLTEEMDEKIAAVETDVETNYATKNELSQAIMGQIPDGAITKNKLETNIQSALDTVPMIEKYNQLANPVVTNVTGGYNNAFTLSAIPTSPTTGQIVYIKTPSADTVQNGTKYYNGDYKIEATSVASGHDVSKAFDDDDTTYCETSGTNTTDSVIIELAEAKALTKIKTYITGDNFSSVTIKGSADGETYSSLLVLSSADTSLTEHTLSLSGTYKYIKTEITVTSGSAKIYGIKLEEDASIPTTWILGNGNGMITTNLKSNTLNGKVIDTIMNKSTEYKLIYDGTKFVEVDIDRLTKYILFPDTLTTAEKASIESNTNYMNIINSSRLYKSKLIATFDEEGIYDWVVPDGVKKIFAYIVGGGGSGAATKGTYRGAGYDITAGGGGSGYVSKVAIDVTAGDTIPIVVGGGGANSVNAVGCNFATTNCDARSLGNAGGTSSVNGITALGGSGGSCLTVGMSALGNANGGIPLINTNVSKTPRLLLSGSTLYGQNINDFMNPFGYIDMCTGGVAKTTTVASGGTLTDDQLITINPLITDGVGLPKAGFNNSNLTVDDTTRNGCGGSGVAVTYNRNSSTSDVLTSGKGGDGLVLIYDITI